MHILQIKAENKESGILSSVDESCDVSYIHSNNPDTLAKNLLVTTNDLDSLYHIISPIIKNIDIKNLLEQRLNANQEVNIVEQMFKIQIAVFSKVGPSAVSNQELRDELVQIKQNISDRFLEDLKKSIEVITKWAENDQNKEKFLHFVLNACE